MAQSGAIISTLPKQLRRTTRKRLISVTTLFMVLLGIALYFFLSLLAELNHRIDVAAKELLGAEYIHATFTLERDLLFHRYLYIEKHDETFQARLAAARSQVDRDIHALEALDERLGATLQTTGSWARIRRHWEPLRDHADSMSAQERFDAQTALIGELIDLIVNVANQSHLILDPALASYYLIDTAVTQLPTLLEQLGQIRARLLRETVPSALSQEEKVVIFRYATLISHTHDLIRHNFKQVFVSASESSLRQRLTPGIQTSDKAVSRVLALLHAMTNGGTDSRARHRSIVAATTEAVSAGSGLHDLIIPVIEEMVQARIDEISRKKLQAMVIAAGTAVLVIGLFVSFFTSHTSRERAERELLAQESRFRTMIHDALDAVVSMDRDGLVVEWNPQAESIFGYSRSEAVGRRLSDLIIPPQYREAHTAGMQRFLSTGESKILRQRIEIMALRKNGEVFPVELTIIPLHIGEQVLFASFIRDITARKQADATIKASQDRLRTLFDHAASAILVLNRDGEVLDMNGEAEALYGRSLRELAGKHYADHCLPEEARADVTADLQQVLTGSVTRGFENPVIAADGTQKVMSWNVSRFMDLNGNPGGVIAIGQDITHKKKTEKAFLDSVLAAEETSRTKSDFLANMSHEMRTPLTAIVGISDYLLRTELGPEQRGLVQRCMKASDGLLRLIEDLLLAAKTESGTLELISESFILQEIVEEAADLLRTEIEEKGLHLTVELAPSLPAQVEGDSHRLQQILLNLIRNAIKFTNHGRITVSVTPSSDSHHAHLVQFAVADTGIGIEPEHCVTIFDRFTQADSRSNRKYGGVGLGLSICKRLVELMGGRIWVESAKGNGSRFSFTIPFKGLQPSAERPQPAAHQQPATVAPSQASIPLATRGLSILLAEDSMETQEVFRLYLRGTAHRIECASTGTKVLSLFKERPYDLVFMDLHMPEMDGLTATKLIRNWEAVKGRPRTPLVALTANGMLEAQRESLEAGCDDYLTKPIKMEQLLDAIGRYASRGGAGESTSVPPPSIPEQEGMDQTLADLRPKFLQNRRRDIDALENALGVKDFEQIRTIGHRIKGLAGSYGLDEIGQIGGALEQAALAKDVHLITHHVAHLIEAIQQAQSRFGNTNPQHRAA